MPTSVESKGGDSWFLSEISPDDKPWDITRALAQEFEKLCELCDRPRYAERVRECSRWLTYALKAMDDGQLKLRLREAKFCRVRFCPICQWRKSLMWRARFFKALPEIQKAFPSGRYIFLTLTVRNCPIAELRKNITSINSAWKRLTERKVFPGLGYVKSIEVTRGADGTAHPHIHCLMLVPAGYFSRGYISQANWGTLWQSCLKSDYTPRVDIRVVKAEKDTLNATIDTSETAMRKAICETLKYAVKPVDLLADPKWLDELMTQLQKTKAITVGGCFKEFLSEKEPEDLIDGEIEEEENTDDEFFMVFEWLSSAKRYVKSSNSKIQ